MKTEPDAVVLLVPEIMRIKRRKGIKGKRRNKKAVNEMTIIMNNKAEKVHKPPAKHTHECANSLC